MKKLPKLKSGDKVAIVSPSFAASGQWPHVHELGLERLKTVFGLEAVELPATRKLGATGAERAEDLVIAFSDPTIKAVISSLGGDDQVTYIKNLPAEPFINNPKPFFGFSDNSHFCNFLFLNGIPSYYGAALFTQFAKQGAMDDFSVKYIKHALFDEGEFELQSSDVYNDSNLSADENVILNWDDPESLQLQRKYVPNEGWYWAGEQDAKGLLWGGCIESVDEMLRHGVPIPTLEQFENIVLMLESSEEIPSAQYVFRIMRALGERGILASVKGVLVGRPKAWEFDKQNNDEQKARYCQTQRDTILQTIRQYNQFIPVIQNLDFGHTDPQIPMPYGGKVRVQATEQKIFVTF
ncbi:MAG: hypothetical protein RLZZ230_53 [Candidatus Parcubacteria bacterium]|jgi:muramoyltetrapeptide carboxypeptidase LdcA involved in peptidoglycan recycling